VLLPLFTSPIPLPLYTPKSLPVNLFADPHPLNPLPSIFYKNLAGALLHPRAPRFAERGHYYTWVVRLPQKGRRAATSGSYPFTFLVRYLGTPKFFPCHTSEKSTPKSNHCHTSKIAKNNPCICHTSETPRVGVRSLYLSFQLSTFPLSTFDLFYPAPLFSYSCALLRTLAHSFALFCSLLHFFALFCTHAKLNPFIFKRFHTLCTKHPGVGRVVLLDNAAAGYGVTRSITTPCEGTFALKLGVDLPRSFLAQRSRTAAERWAGYPRASHETEISASEAPRFSKTTARLN